MGLSICLYESVDSFRAGSYSGFGIFRELLASSVHIALNNMVGFGGETEWTKEEPFYELLNHSDCDGKLTWVDCESLMEDFTDERRIAFMDSWRFKGISLEDATYYTDRYDLWAEFIRRCAKNCGILIFC